MLGNCEQNDIKQRIHNLTKCRHQKKRKSQEKRILTWSSPTPQYGLKSYGAF